MKTFLILLIAAHASYCEKVTARTGTYVGYEKKTSANTVYHAFEGIKYATQKRFQPGTPLPPSSKEISAMAPGPACIQMISGSPYGDEDCLYLNLYTPQINGSLPVMVFIHGGGFVNGQAFTGADFFMDTKRVVYAFIQYRLGPFGFIDFDSQKYPANLGQKDMILSLQWIKENINKFGGNPNNVIIQGESSGSVSVHLLMLSPLAKGLFHAAIGESGVGCTPWAVAPKKESRSNLESLGMITNCSQFIPPEGFPADIAAECLIHLEQKELSEASVHITILKPLAYMPYRPVLEPPEWPNAFLSKFPWEEPTNQVPWITGINSNEGLNLMSDYGFPDDYLRKLFDLGMLDSVIPDLIQYRYTAKKPDQVTQEIKKFYTKNSPIDEGNCIEYLDKVLTGGMFKFPKYQCLGLHTGSPSYSYNFGYLRDFEVNKTGVQHAEELEYLFVQPNGYNVRTNGTKIDAWMSETFVELLVSFAESRIPTSGNIIWERYNQKEGILHFKKPKRVLKIDNNGFRMVDLTNTAEMKFWKSLPFRNNYRKFRI